MSSKDHQQQEQLDLPSFIPSSSISVLKDSSAPESQPASCVGPNRTCQRSGWLTFFRALQCPCGRPKNPKVSKSGQVKNITLRLPVTPDDSFNRPDNVVITSKYTPWDFAFLASVLQFRRAINVYYLIIVILLVIGDYFPNLFETPYPPWGTLSVLIFVIGVTMIFEGHDDLNRHKLDAKMNSTKVSKFNALDGAVFKSTWGGLSPGDIILLHDRELVPADVIVLDTSHAGGMLYIETSGIDGETNLKIKKAPADLPTYISSKQSWPILSGKLECEEPNPFLSFSGALVMDDQKTVSLGFESLLLRGSEVRNTKWVLCLVAYAGHESKLILSKRSTPSKFASLDLLINRLVGWAVLEQVCLVVVSVCVLFLATPATDSIWYFKGFSVVSGYSLPGWLAYLLTFWIIYANCVPISLYVVVELANAMQSLFLLLDIEMYDEHTDTASTTKSTNLISEIGQVSHVFSDKTGTLTQNVMRLVGMSIAGKRYGLAVPDAMLNADSETAIPAAPPEGLGKRLLDQTVLFRDLLTQVPQNELVRDFLLGLSLCHTVVIDHDKSGVARYNAEGPDEEALVEACKALGFILKNTSNQTYTIEIVHSGATLEYNVLAVLGFSSDRKRMSIIVREVASGVVTLWSKGADSIIAELSVNQTCPALLASDLDAFAQNGLRTLLVAKRVLSSEETEAFLVQFGQARAVVGPRRAEAMEQIARTVERNLEIIGATAIEDALQEGVPDAIEVLRNAKIKVWVLTGDKVDTGLSLSLSLSLGGLYLA